jgi:hypothetical protein
MSTREKLFDYLNSRPCFKTTIPELAFKIGVSRDGVAKAVRDLEIAGRIKIVERKWGDYTIYGVVPKNV